MTVSEETVDSFTVNGVRAKWYRIVDPVEGWVFGAFLKPGNGPD
uniref:SH3 domain-containing protein n=1 Tax=Breznakiella homolactica TaxID=2798577 RepID=A0A7T8B977_9SPIR